MERRVTASDGSEHASDEESVTGRCPVDRSRRLLLQTTAASAAVSLAGCIGFFETEGDEAPEDFVEEDEDGEDEEIFNVEFLRAEKTVEVGAGETVLEAGREAGVSFTDGRSCTVGSCGRCESHVEGDARDVMVIDGQDAIDDDDNADGAFLPCVSRPREDFAVDERPEEGTSPLSE